MSKNYRILNTIGDVFTPEAKKILDSAGDVTYRTPSQEELPVLLSGYDVAIIGLGLVFNKSVLENASQLKVIATATTGLDHIDMEAAKACGIEVLSLRGEETFLKTITGTAELAFGLLLDLVRLTPWAFESVKNYEWEREKFRGHSVYGKTLGIVGMGRLGSLTARYGEAFGMNVVFYDPYVNSALGRLTSKSVTATWTSHVQVAVQAGRVDFEELLHVSDVISIHVHLSKETEDMFNAGVFKQMKKSAYLINTSRGKIVNENDLLETLTQENLAGYATDVLEGELDFGSEFSNHPLVEYAKTHQNVIIVPHIGGMTHEARRDTDLFIARKLAAYLKRTPA